jgi:glycosyltransferase involved in cell wall biosynthesis
MSVEASGHAERGTIAYVLKGFPRMSETFIAGEIYRLEQAGVRLRLFATKQDETYRHPVVDRIRAPLVYLPAVRSPSRSASLLAWLAATVPTFRSAMLRCARRRPLGLARAAAAALAQAMRARWSWSQPRGVYFKEFLQAVALADRLLESSDVCHIHAHFAHGATTVAWLAGIICGLPFSFTAHATDIYRESVNPAGLLRRKLAAARFVVTCTGANRAYLLERAGGTPVYRIYHGLNADFVDLLAKAPARPDRTRGDCLRILSVGRLVPKKGFDVLVDACGILEQRGVAFEAIIVGETGDPEDSAASSPHSVDAALPGSPAARRRYADEIRQRIAQLQLEQRVRLVGSMSQAALFAEYQAATLFCLPCRIVEDGDRDGIPNVLAEAMACGIPVVTTPVSGIPELVEHCSNGLLVPAEDPEAIAAAVCQVRTEPGLANRLGRAAQTTIRERFDADESAQQLVALFRERALA